MMKWVQEAILCGICLCSGCSLLVGDYSANSKEEDGSANVEDAGAGDDGSAGAEESVAEEESTPPCGPIGQLVRVCQKSPPTSPPLPADSITTNVVVETDKDAQCKYSWIANTPFEKMSLSFNLNDNASNTHSVNIPLVNGQAYNMYVSCQDTSSATSIGSLTVRFSVDQGTNKIFRSVSGVTTNLAEGNGLTLEDNWVSFESPLNSKYQIGVGDILSMGDRDNPTACLMIVGRVGDQERFAVRGIYLDLVALPQDTSQVPWRICRAYTDVSRAMLGKGNTATCFEKCPQLNSEGDVLESATRSLVAKEWIWNIVGYNDGLDVEGWALYITTDPPQQDWETDSDHYLRIYSPYLPNEVAVSQRHQGVWAAGGENKGFSIKKISINNGVFVFGSDQHVWIDGLMVDVTLYDSACSNCGSNFFFRVDPHGSTQGWAKLSNNLVQGHGPPGALVDGSIYNSAVWQYSNACASLYLWNNVFFGFRQISNGRVAYAMLLEDPGLNSNWYVFNNTFVNNQYAIAGNSANGNLLLVNNLFSFSQGDYTELYGTISILPGSFHNATTQISSMVSCPKCTSLPNVEPCSSTTTGKNYHTCAFSFSSAIDNNFHLLFGDQGAKDKGICPNFNSLVPNAGFAFDDDFETQGRPDCDPGIDDKWDIGADEFK